MNDKKNNSNSEDKPNSDDIELFDKIFAQTQITKAPDSKKESLSLDKTTDKKVQKKVEQKVEFPPKKSTKKPIPPARLSKSKPSIKQYAHPKKKTPDTVPHKTATKRTPQKTNQGIKLQVEPSIEEDSSTAKSILVESRSQRDMSIKESPLIAESSVEREIKRTKLLEENKNLLNTFIFTLMIIVLVILSMFTGRVMDYDVINKIFKTTRSLTFTSENISYDNKNKVTENITNDLKEILPEKDVVKLKTEESVIEAKETIREEKGIGIPSTAPLLPKEQTADESSYVYNEALLSYQYSIYLGSYKTITKVKEASVSYIEMGILPYWVKLDLDEKGIWFRLFAGYFQTRKEADEFIKTRKIKDAETKRIRYANLIGVYTSKEEIERQKAILEKMEYSPYVISDTANIFRLFVGAFYQKARAEEQNSDLANNGIHSQLIER